MTKYIGQITVILETATPDLASESLSFLARQLDDIRPEVVFADHNGEVEDYEEIERECEESLTTAPAMTANDSILTDIAGSTWAFQHWILADRTVSTSTMWPSGASPRH
jgi:hypothetical protein